MKLEDYKIETNGLNEAILHKAVEEGYDDRTDHRLFLNANYFHLNETRAISWSMRSDYFADQPETEISAHDFLRLNWRPAVGEEVECVSCDYLCVGMGERVIISEVVEENHIRLEGISLRYIAKDFIPIYPKKGQPKEKPDAYIAMEDMPLYPKLIFRDEDMNMNLDGMLDEAYQYNLLSESDYKAKYPDKLMFKNWEVEGGCSSIKIGDIRLPHASVRYIYRSVKDSNVTPKELKSITLWDTYEFLNANEARLGL